MVIENIECTLVLLLSMAHQERQEVKPKCIQGPLKGDENVKFRVKCPFNVQKIK